MKVERIMGKAGRTKSFAYQLDEKRADFSNYDATYCSILKDTKGKSYLVQKGIHLLKHIGRPFDTRLVVQRAPYGGWEATGTISKRSRNGRAGTKMSFSPTLSTD